MANNKSSQRGGQDKRRQGFASLNEDQRKQIASKGGKAAHEQGSAHEWNSKEAAEAGRKGGRARSRGRGNR